MSDEQDDSDLGGGNEEDGALDANLPVSLAVMRDWMRVSGGGEDDAVLAGLIRAATGLCEAFTGQMLMVRDCVWRGDWERGTRGVILPGRPVVAVDRVALVTVGLADSVLDPQHYHVAIDRDGTAMVRVETFYGRRALAISYRAGLVEVQAAVPDALRHGIIRMVQHLYETRDAPISGQMPPAAVAALWQPWRRVTLGGRR